MNNEEANVRINKFLESEYMSNADKMFEKLFYKKTADNIDFIEYTNTITKFIIRFWKRRKTLYLMDEANIKLQKAIFAKLKELGWLDD